MFWFIIAALSAIASLQTYRLVRRGRKLKSANTALSDANKTLFTLNQQLQAANSRLKEADAAKTDFFSNVSHELRTPLTAIKGYVDNMLDGIIGEMSDKQSRYLTRVKSNADRLSRLINDLLDLSRIDRGRMDLLQLAVGKLPATEIIRDAVENLQPLAESEGLELTFEGPELYAVADRDRLTQIVTNLVNNAIKFTGTGGKINVSVKRDSTGHVQTIVRDTGKGIPPEAVDRIFDRFYQVELDSGNHPGTGLGLPITKELVHLQGGDIWVRSQVGVGSTFIFTLPETQIAGGTEAQPPKNESALMDSGS